jgi:hypothetical protein
MTGAADAGDPILASANALRYAREFSASLVMISSSFSRPRIITCQGGGVFEEAAMKALVDRRSAELSERYVQYLEIFMVDLWSDHGLIEFRAGYSLATKPTKVCRSDAKPDYSRSPRCKRSIHCRTNDFLPDGRSGSFGRVGLSGSCATWKSQILGSRLK